MHSRAPSSAKVRSALVRIRVCLPEPQWVWQCTCRHNYMLMPNYTRQCICSCNSMRGSAYAGTTACMAVHVPVRQRTRKCTCQGHSVHRGAHAGATWCMTVHKPVLQGAWRCPCQCHCVQGSAHASSTGYTFRHYEVYRRAHASAIVHTAVHMVVPELALCYCDSKTYVVAIMCTAVHLPVPQRFDNAPADTVVCTLVRMPMQECIRVPYNAHVHAP